MEFELGCASVLDEALQVPVLTYDSETLISREKKRSRIEAVEVEHLKRFAGYQKNV